ncbi:hypothetical protein LCGC14_2269930, partial [marine sediment metagenome]
TIAVADVERLAAQEPAQDEQKREAG